jgi:hypothetical protein
VTTVSSSKSQVGGMSVISGETPSLLSGLSGLEEPSPSEIEFISDPPASTTSKSQAVR